MAGHMYGGVTKLQHRHAPPCTADAPPCTADAPAAPTAPAENSVVTVRVT